MISEEEARCEERLQGIQSATIAATHDFHRQAETYYKKGRTK
jgi:hypothetical protein